MTRTCHIGPGQPLHAMRLYHRFCWTLSRAGQQVDLIAHGDGQTQAGEFNVIDLGSLGASTLKWRLGARLARCIRAFREALKTRADLYVFYSPEFIPFGILLKWVSRKPVIFDCMEDFVGYARQRRGIPDRLRGPLATAVGWAFGLAARCLDHITVADQGTEEQFRRHTPNVLTVYNFPRLEFFPPVADDRMEHCEFDLVYHGSIPRYHLDMTLAIDAELLSAGREVRWYLFGKSPEFDWFRGELRKRGAEARFRLGEFIPHDQVNGEVQRARIGIIPLPLLPKFLNNIPQKLFEYMALGLPVVLSDLPPSRPFVVGHEVGIMVDPVDPAAYAQAILQLLDDPARCRQMGRNGRALVEQHHNWDSEGKKLVDLVDGLIAAAGVGNVSRIPSTTR